MKSLSRDLRLIVKLLSPIVICLPNCVSFTLYLAVLRGLFISSFVTTRVVIASVYFQVSIVMSVSRYALVNSIVIVLFC